MTFSETSGEVGPARLKVAAIQTGICSEKKAYLLKTKKVLLSQHLLKISLEPLKVQWSAACRGQQKRSLPGSQVLFQ